MSSPRIAIATCAAYADLKVDDELLREELRVRGCDARPVTWDEAGIEWGGFDLCLIRSTWDYHDKHAEFLAWARLVGGASTLHNPSRLVAWNSDKTYLRTLAGRGVRIVPTVWLSPGAEADVEAVLAERGWEEAVVKPVVDLGARNLSRVRAADGGGQLALEAALARQGAMVQPFLPSLEAEGELSLIYIEGAFSHAVRKRPAEGDFRVQSIWGGTMEAADPSIEQTQLAEQAMSHLHPLPLYARVDLVDGLDGRPCLIELELIEPNLYLSQYPAAAGLLADAALKLL